MTTPDPGVYISPAQTYQEVRDLSRKFDRIEAKLDGVLNETRDIRGDVTDHETRLRSLEKGETELQKRETARIDALEKGRWPLPSVAALTALGALGVAVWSAVGR
ncbi:hypothetical protein H1V43_32060 [Streptomyces sp. PSKA54]|uniref:Uncharacterized protein n=1 Tax=Streptomyces himalayensis subsp. aureolus TaxID=2758039 RepID=A0A7W2D7I7_9ACTN|nr:hypothetical protein [Streptomyces himalayensis]MBA4865900.1 hypothetical protein [Streptomyces himalayensis subsp. aureolus]